MRAGINRIAITSLHGSWALYDWLGFHAPAGTAIASVEDTTALVAVHGVDVLTRSGDGALSQPVKVNLLHLGEPRKLAITDEDMPPQPVSLQAGSHRVEIAVPSVEQPRAVTIACCQNGAVLDQMETTLRPVRKWDCTSSITPISTSEYTHVQPR